MHLFDIRLFLCSLRSHGLCSDGARGGQILKCCTTPHGYFSNYNYNTQFKRSDEAIVIVSFRQMGNNVGLCYIINMEMA